MGHPSRFSLCPRFSFTQAKSGLEWATRPLGVLRVVFEPVNEDHGVPIDGF